MNKEKYIGESALNDKPGKKLTLVIKDGSVITPKIADENVTTEKMADGAITAPKVAEQAITDSKLGDKAVVERTINEGAVTASKIALGAVETDKIVDENVTNEKLAEDSVTTSKIKDESVTEDKLAELSVGTSKIKDGAVTNDKVANDSLTRDKLDPELRNTLDAATGLPEDLMETIQNVDKTLKDHQSQLDDKQSQIDDKQQQITSNDGDISLLQIRSTQMEEAIKGISASGGASQASAVTYENTESGLDSVTAQGAIDELASKKFNKGNIAQEFGDSDDKVVSQFALPFREIESPEFIKAIVDAEDHFLLGIQLDGSIEWGKGIPSPIRAKLQEIINQCQQDKTDILEAINAAKEELSASIAALQEGKVDKEEGKSLIEDEVKECFRVIENEEFIHAVIDSEGRLLFGIYRDSGKPYFPQNDMYHISQSEEFLWVILDAANHPLLGIQQDGTCWAAKAQWLDDIKAIKEALKTFQPKEDGKGLINLDVADSFFYISNDEYIIAVVDAENRILAGIKYDGEPYFPNHEMYSVITNEEWLYAIIDAENKVLCGFRADDGHMVVGGIDISTFIANAIIDIADIKERTAHLSTIENDEYLSVETDAEGKVIGYIAPDGSHYLYKVKSETIPTEFEHIEDPEGRTEITTDAEDKVMSYRDADGKKHEHDMEITNLDVSNLNLQGNSVNNIQDSLKANGFNVKTPIDWSENSKIQIPEPSLAIVNITNIKYMPTSKGQDMHAIFEFWDMQGNYFKKKVILNAQGNSSLGMPKKNFACDFCNDDWIGDDTFKIKFGNWVPQDSFHFKAFYADFFKGVSMVGYKLFNEIELTRSFNTNRIWKRALLPSADIIGFGTKGMESISDINILIDNGARCYPDGFPCIVHLNGSFYGVFSWALKKHRDNYMQNKSKPENIQLDGDIYDTFSYNGNIDWDVVSGNKEASNTNMDGVEFRNPKSLICFDGTKYDGDTNRKELIDSLSEYYDSSNKNHVITSKVKAYYTTLTTYIPTLKKMEEQSEETSVIKSKIQSFFDVDSLMDYLIFSDVVANTDGFRKNWQWVTYNGIKWAVCPYDLDGIFGWNGWSEQSPTMSRLGDNLQLPTGWVIKYFEEELCARYRELRANILTKQNILTIFCGWCSRIGASNYDNDLSKWPQTPELYSPFKEKHIDNIYRVENWIITRLKKCDEIYKFN